MDYLSYIFRREIIKEIAETKDIEIFIHDQKHTVKAVDFTPDTSLNKYLRENLFLTGTKVMCQEGGCGCCIVTATTSHPVTKKEITFAVNSCLVSIFSCHGWRISTVEGIGNPKIGYHRIQNVLTQFNGTQCGFCSSGMVMNMFQLYQKEGLTMKEVENSFGGNMCRCTGYRPILAAFKSLCSDADPDIIGHHADIEDLRTCKSTKCKQQCLNACANRNEPICFNLGQSKWYKLFTINDIIEVLGKSSNAPYMLVSGNTAKGVYREKKNIEIFIDVSSIKELLGYTVNDNNLILGANMNLTEAMELFYKIGNENHKYSYLIQMADHIDIIANVPVRNVGSIAGNLSIKHEHHEFPSDVYLIFETVGATLTIVGLDKKEENVNLIDYLAHDMRGKILKNIILPVLDDDHKYESYKIMPRAQNAHALVNAGFRLKFDQNNQVQSASIVYGCISQEFIHAKETEKFLIGKNIFDNKTLQEALKTLDGELQPDYVLPDPTPEFRKKLAIALFYKFVLSIAPQNIISPRNRSGGIKQIRPVSKGTQDYETNESLYPLTQPISKIEAMAQVSGQAEFIMDMPNHPGQLFGAFVLAKAAPNSVIAKIDKSKAMAVKGVVEFFDKSDIPGVNSFVPLGLWFPVGEELFCSGVVKYYFQPIGIIVATSQEIAEKAAELVEINYEPGQRKPLITIRDILKENAKDKIINDSNIEPTRKGNDVNHVIKGSFDIGMQYHYHMETQCCNVVPVEDGLNVYPSSQGLDIIQSGIASTLKMDANKINVSIRRLGGAYGAKISRNGLISCAAALASYKLHKPVKIWMPFITNMNVIGKRCPCSADYEIGVDDAGVIQYLTTSVYSDYGSSDNEQVMHELLKLFANTYIHDTFKISANNTRTDTPANTWCRAPGTTEGLALIETILDHVAYTIGIDPLQIRSLNLNKSEHPVLATFIKDFTQWAEIEERKKVIQEFNKNNRWVKKGISVVPMAYEFGLFGNWNVLISIYNIDGSVAIAHAGIEMGQGINTKAAQVCAYALGIPLQKVSVKPSNSLVSPNGVPTGGSVTSEAVCFGVLQAAEILKERMKPVKEKMNNPTWPELIRQCYVENVELAAMYMFDPKNPNVHGYTIYGICSTEVEVDLLTGNHQITRVDLLEDTGNSMSPQIDIGQVEGAFIMGQGYWTTEQIVFNDKGELLTNRTWTYKPPGVKDIPIDFRVKFPKNNPNPLGVLKSKATAEPPLCLAVSLPLAIRNAIASARYDSNPEADKWYPFGTTEGLALIETILDHVAYTIGIDPLQIRSLNLNKSEHPVLATFIKDFTQWAEIEERKKVIQEFNKNNRWVKKGISVVPMAYEFGLFGNWNVLISIYNIDGSVAIAHAGIEMGQGINTKAAQVCAYALGIPLQKVSVKPSNSLVSPNGVPTGGSVTSEAVCFGVLQAAEILKERMKPVKEKMNNPTWPELIRQCYVENVELAAMYMFDPKNPNVHGYTIYGICSTEVEVDLLTGNHQITRVDLLEDTGNSMSPQIDIGQVEGAFIMGQGYWTTEQIVFNDKGELLTNRTWTYKPPGVKDIPIDFRVKFPKNNPNPLGVLKSKATAEPPLCLAVSLPLAIRNAIASARYDSNPEADKWYPFDGPSTVENTFINSLHEYEQYTL